MIRIIPKIPGYISFYNTGLPELLPFNLTISVSYNCNSRCKTCDIWKKHVNDLLVRPLQKSKTFEKPSFSNDLTLKEYEKIFKNYGNIFWVTLSGGEPFLRKDLDKLAILVYKYCKPKIINIPTNGLMGEYTAKKAEEIAKACPNSEIVVNLSLDGIEKQHDEIRGIPGNWKRAMLAYQKLRKIKLKNFTLGVHTVISKFNSKSIPKITDYILDELKPDSYISEVAEERGEMDNFSKNITPSSKDYAKAVDYLSQRTSKMKSKGVSKFTSAFRSTYYKFAKKVLETNRQPIPCYSGVASGQISPDGDVWGCCVRAEPLGNLRKNNYDFKKIWFGATANKFRESVKNKECACPLANAYYSSAVMDHATILKVFGKLI